MQKINSTSKQQTRFLGVDFFRFICALSVVLFHYCYRINLSDNIIKFHLQIPAIGKLFAYNFLGVQLFFIISGFVIMNSAWQKTPKDFTVARFLRLYPAFLICCTLTFICLTFIPLGTEGIENFHRPTFSQYIANLTMLNNYMRINYIDGVYWTLQYEITFYFLVFLMLLIRQLPHFESFLILGVSFSALHWALKGLDINLPKAEHYIAIFFIPEIFCFFAIGAIQYLSWLHGLSLGRFILLVVAYLLSLLQIHAMCSQFNYNGGATLDSSTAIVIYSAALLLLMCAVRYSHIFKNASLWIFLGNLTYPLYLIHQNIGYIFIHTFSKNTNPYALILCTVGLILLLTIGIHLFGEIPLRRWFKKIILKVPAFANPI